MANTSQTIFQRLGTIFSGRNSVSPIMTKLPPTFDSVASNQVLYSTKDRNDYERKLNQYKQQKLLSYQWVKAGVDNSIESLAGLTAVKLMYRDADLMDGMPEIGAALDILSEEACLVGETKIKLLNGKTETIENLYKNKCANFWVYSVDESGICRPSCVEKVIYKGEKEVIKITLDDGTIVRCTPDHKLMLSDCSWKEAKDLAFGDSLMSIYDDINYLGYEQIKSTVENKKRLTHRVVAENVLRDEKLKLSSTNVPYQKIVIHHNTFNKLNNEPSALTYMYWNDHQKLHNDLNHKRWENTEFSEKMSKIFSETAKKTWAEKGDIIKEKMSYNWDRFKKSDRYEEWKKQVNRSGAENGMYDIHRYGDLNPNYNRNANHFNDINEDEYVEFIISQKNIKRENLQKKFNLTKKGVCDYNKYICKKYGVDSICQIKYAHDNGCSFNLIFNEIEKNPYIKIEELCNKIGYSKHQIRKVLKEKGTSLSKIESTFKNPWGNILKEEYISFIGTLNQKEKINDILSEKFNISKKKVCRLNSLLLKEFGIKSINSLKYLTCDNYDFNKIKSLVMNSASLSDVLNELNISKHEFSNIVKRNGYKDYRDLKKNLYNHRVTSVEIENGKEKVYDLLNSSTNNCFGIKCNNGQIISHNCAMKSNGKMLNVYSKSKRVKAILEDLFVNRLHIHTDLPMIARATLKYGNQFMLLNIDEENGILGWKQLPVYEIDRVENGYTTSPSAGAIPINASDIRPDKTRFIWVGHNESTPYEDWQMAHFRLLKDSFFLPYGVSHLHKARRAWRMWSMMEDAMLIYRLDKSIERRVFKIYVGSIDDQDVPAFIQQVADNFKRTPVIDPLTGQIDLRKNFLDVSSDYFIPVRDPSAPTPIENLASAQNPTSMDDINYMQNKVFSALRVPKQFLNFQEAQGKGQNLSLLDVRFARMVNTLQQFLLLELNKIAMIHLHLLGLDDDIMNFTLSLNNPSAQIEALELEDLTKRVNTATQALADPGIGMPLMSLHMVLKKIMKFTDSEIKDMLNEIRLEKAMAAELANTAAIIKKTGMFDAVDNIYGDYDAMNDPNASAQQPGMGNENDMGMGMSGGGAIGGGGGGFDGGALTFDSLEGGGDMGGSMGDINGTEATTDMSNAPNLDAGKPNESKDKNKPLLNEARSKFFNSAKSFTQRYFDLLSELERRDNGNEEELANIEGKVTTINEQIGNLFNKIDAILEENSNPDFSKTVEDNDDEMITSPSTSITESDLDNELLSNE